jgi:hypothetical protein
VCRIEGRFTGSGLYLLDEAEGPLSFQSTLVLLTSFSALPSGVGAVCSFSEWHTTMVASKSITRPASSRPPARAGGQARPVISARCAQSGFRAAAWGLINRGKFRLADPIQHAPARRVRRHRTEQLGLVDQHRNVRDRLRAIGHRDRQINQNSTQVMAGPGSPQHAQTLRQLAGQKPGILGPSVVGVYPRCCTRSCP